jgi:hypothetical protein
MCLIIINKLVNNSIIMNDSISILLATTVLALGGLGLYMFKSSDNNQTGWVEDYSEEGLFGSGGSGSLLNWGSTGDNGEDEDKLEEIDEEDYKPRKRGPKTLKNRKSTGTSRRRYY